MSNFVAVGAVARALGVSVRTLHHWHQAGVVVPSKRSDAGYRLYSEADFARLQRVLVLRDLGVPLTRIPALLEASATARRDELEARRANLAGKIHLLQEVDRELERLLAADERGILLSVDDQVHAFGEDWDNSWTAAARDRWADSPQWAEYAERSAGRTAADWQRISLAMQAVIELMAAAKRENIQAGSERANELAERHRKVMSEYFHCTHSMHVLIARQYVEEAGFQESYERVEPGLAAWLKRTIDANARTTGLDPATAAWE